MGSIIPKSYVGGLMADVPFSGDAIVLLAAILLARAAVEYVLCVQLLIMYNYC